MNGLLTKTGVARLFRASSPTPVLPRRSEVPANVPVQGPAAAPASDPPKIAEKAEESSPSDASPQNASGGETAGSDDVEFDCGYSPVPAYMAAPFAVSWQCCKLETVTAQLERDIESDFQWWFSDPNYNPLKLFMAYYRTSEFGLNDFYPESERYTSCLTLQIDLLLPQAHYFDLRYPGQAYSFMLDLDHIARHTMHNHAELGSKWIGLATSTRNDSLVSALRRTMFFPDVSHFNKLRGTAFEDITPSAPFARTFETWLNSFGIVQIEAGHWGDNFHAYYGPGQLADQAFNF